MSNAMKKLIIAMMALAATSGLYAKTADELRVYINPGHGSWTANDRPCVIVGHKAYDRYNTDTTNFFESNTNLRKGFGVLEKLRTYGLKYDPSLNQEGELHQIGAARDMNNNIVMSHVKCGPFHEDNGTKGQLGDAAPEDLEWYNRNLTEIAAEVDANHFDMFISIHSNAAGEGTGTNFPLFLYRGFDTPTEHEGCTLEHQTTSRAMADACWLYSIENPHMVWTAYSATSKNVRGDCNFYASPGYGRENLYGYLGVLKHTVPGFLVEGYFHTYQPARHRAMNWDVDYMEGAAYAHGIADYFGLTKESTGDIYGIVRDANERFSDDYYKPNTTSLDRFLPLNGCTAILNKDGVEVARYTTDFNYNGAFVFKDVEPGTYTITFESEQYLPGDPVEVEVKAAQISYPSAQLVDKDWVPDTEVYYNYPDYLADLGSLLPAAQYTVEASYIDEPIAELEGKVIKRMIAHKGKLYILALDKAIVEGANVAVEEQAVPTVIVYDPEAKAVVATVSTTGAAGSFAAIADIQVTADGVLLASNGTKNQYSDDQIQEGDAGRGTFIIYKWANDENGLPTGDPTEWITTQASGLWFRAYPSRFAYSGTTTEGNIVVPMPTVGDARTVRSTYISVMDGAKQGETDYRSNAATTKFSETGSDVTIFTSPLADDQVIMIDAVKGVRSWSFGEAFDGEPTFSGNEVLSVADGRAGMFRYAGAAFLVMPDNAEGINRGVRMVNISDNLNGAVETELTVPADLAEVEAPPTAAAGETVVTRDEYSLEPVGGWINLYLLRNGKLTKLTTQNVKQPQGRNEFAYDVVAAENDETYDITFKLTGDATDVDIVLTNTENAEDVITYPMGALAAGEQTYVIKKSELNQEANYTWSVNVTSAPIAQAGVYSADASGLTVRGGAVVITDPEAESFGYVTVGHGKNAGIDIYDPTGVKVADRVFKDHAMFGGVTSNQSNPFRGNEREGMAVFATWGDAGYGIVALNPMDVATEPFTLFAGTKDGTGCFTYDGVKLGGGNSGFDFIGEGNDTYVISFSEDHEGSNGSGSTENTLVRYYLGSGWEITTAPESFGYGGLLANTNVDVLTYGDGVWCAQVRGAGNNQAGTPYFAYIADVLTAPDCVLTSADEGVCESITAGSNAAIAITVDGSTLAVGFTNSIAIFDVAWEENKPVLTLKYTFEIDTNSWAHMRFDAAGNLHAYLREGGYRVYTLPNAAPEAVTPAAAKYTFYGSESAIRDITTEEAAAATNAVFYNLQGVQVPASNLTPGIYVKVCGTTATKVLVK